MVATDRGPGLACREAIPQSLSLASRPLFFSHFKERHWYGSQGPMGHRFLKCGWSWYHLIAFALCVMGFAGLSG